LLGHQNKIPTIYIKYGRVNKLKPDPAATGAHTTFKTDPVTGEVTGHATWDANAMPVQRTDIVGKDHGGVPTPHTHVNDPPQTNPNTGQTFPGKEKTVRPATPNEVPKPKPKTTKS
jgi:hypothetical protein